MPLPRARYALPLLVFGLLAAVVLWPAPADAQCGTQASSCKNCHEVQGEYPVNTEGDWHVQHAFGDFCEFCHAGNVTATDKDAAHEAMIYPLSDPAGSCAACHPADYGDLAVSYGSTLGVEVTVSDDAGDPGGGEPPAGGGDETAEVAPAADDVSGGDVFDLNQRYEANQPRQGAALSAGDVILTIMLIALVGAFGVLIWRFEGLGDKWAQLRGSALQPAHALAGAGASPVIDELAPALEKASPTTLAALNRLLQTDPQQGGQMIEALAHIDPRLVEAVRRLDERDLDMLVALVRELKGRSQGG